MELEHTIPELHFSPCHEILKSWVPAKAAQEETFREEIKLMWACCNGMYRCNTQLECSEGYCQHFFLVYHKALLCYSCSALSSSFLPIHSCIYYQGPLGLVDIPFCKGNLFSIVFAFKLYVQ